MKSINSGILAGGAFVAALTFVCRYLLASTRDAGDKGEFAMGALMHELSALGYLEQQDVTSATQMLQMAVESNILVISKSGTPILDRYAPASRANWLTRYAELRAKYGPIDYHDDGYVNRELDSILGDARKAKTPATTPK